MLPGEDFLQQSHGGFCDGAGLPGVFCNSPTGVFCDGAGLPGVFCISPTEVFCISFHVRTRQLLKQQKLQLENFGFSVFPHIPRRIKKLVLVAVVLLP